jgi:hypothetical protein
MSETKTAKILEVQNVREWTGQNGTLFFHKLVLDNGDRGDLAKKSRDAVKAGDSLTYTIEVTDRGNRIKEIREIRGRGQQANPGAIAAAVALKAATEITVANIQTTGKPIGMNGSLATKITDLADELYTWLRTKE